MAENRWKMLILGLTGQCNFACTYCYAHEHPREIMSMETAVQALEMAGRQGNEFVLQFSGGEPLLAFDRMREISEYVRKKGLPAIMQVQTNASLVNQEMAIYMKEARVGVGISLDGRPAENDAARRMLSGAGTSRSIFSGARVLAEAGVEIGITCVVTGGNVHHLAGVVEMAYYLGNVKKIGFDLLRTQGRGSGVKAARAEDLKEALREVLATAGKLERQTGRKLIFAHQERVKQLAAKKPGGFAHCHGMNGEAAYVDGRGNLYACASLSGLPEFWLGHVKEGVDSGRQRQISRMIRECMDFCTRCPSFALCGGGCFARWHGGRSEEGPYIPECMLKQVFIEEYCKRKDGHR